MWRRRRDERNRGSLRLGKPVSAADAETGKREIIRKCLRGRGYSVLK
jgi:hypothetical protein